MGIPTSLLIKDKKELLLFYKPLKEGEIQREWLKDKAGEVFFLLINMDDRCKYTRSFYVDDVRYKMGYANKYIERGYADYYIIEQVKPRVKEFFRYVSIHEYFRFEDELVFTEEAQKQHTALETELRLRGEAILRANYRKN